MYMIAAIIYVIISGQPYGEPIQVLHKATFTSLEACQEHLKSDAFGADREQLANRMAKALSELRTEANAEDQPLPAVAITASCVTDTRV